MALVWIVGAVESVSVDKSGARFGQVAMPDLVGLFLDADAVQFAAAVAVEKAEFDGFRMLGKNREVDAFAIPGSAQGIGLSRPHNRLTLNDHSVADRALQAGLAPL